MTTTKKPAKGIKSDDQLKRLAGKINQVRLAENALTASERQRLKAFIA